MKRYFEQGKLDRKWIDEYCMGNYMRCVRKKMEEEGKYHPDNMLPDGTIDSDLEWATYKYGFKCSKEATGDNTYSTEIKG